VNTYTTTEYHAE